MNYEMTKEMLEKVLTALDDVKDTFNPDDDEELANIVLKAERTVDRMIDDCELALAINYSEQLDDLSLDQIISVS